MPKRDYNYEAAIAAGIQPDETGHWPSRIGAGPNEGLLLKSEDHPTFHKTLQGERDAGYTIYRKGEQLYSFPQDQQMGPEYQPYTPLLHPELQQIWDQQKQRVADLVSQGVQAYESWGASNREMLEQVPGLGPVMDFTGKIAETPGTDFFAFTAPSAMKNIATGVLERVGERAPASAIRRLVTEVTEGLEPSVTGPVRGPHPRTDYGRGWEFYGGDKPLVLFNPRELQENLGLAYPKNRLQDIAPFLTEKGAAFHELGGHRVSEMLDELDYARMFGSKRALPNPYDYGMEFGRVPQSPGFQQLMKEDWDDLLRMNILPKKYAYPGREVYHLSNYDPSLRFNEEQVSDLAIALAMGADPAKVFARTIPDKDPLLQYWKLKEVQELAKGHYGR